MLFVLKLKFTGNETNSKLVIFVKLSFLDNSIKLKLGEPATIAAYGTNALATGSQNISRKFFASFCLCSNGGSKTVVVCTYSTLLFFVKFVLAL